MVFFIFWPVPIFGVIFIFEVQGGNIPASADMLAALSLIKDLLVNVKMHRNIHTYTNKDIDILAPAVLFTAVVKI